MARHDRLDVLLTLREDGLIPIFDSADPTAACAALDACRAGGARVFELACRTPEAPEVFRALRRHARVSAPEMMVGVGTICDAAMASRYIDEGADFVVSAILDGAMARVCHRRKVAWIPGCATPSEVSAAEALGAELVKLFPAQIAGGPALVKALRGPSPWTRIVASGGVKATKDDISAWFSAGTTVVGLGSGLFAGVKDGAPFPIDAVTERTKQVLAWIREARD